jgi:uncharacterized membrane protein YjgN (DUF898 family)
MDLPTAPGVAPADTTAAAEHRYPIEFTARAGEYFRLWIVNLALSVITLGIYSAWAKVRRRRYFYGHTRLDGEGFEYRANPVAILKGRIIAVAAIAAYYAAGHFAPMYQIVLWIPIIILGPWLLVRSLAFNAYYTAHRNVRFRFDGTYGGCLKVVLSHAWVVLLPIAYPYFKRRLLHFIAENHRYGSARFEVADFKKPFIHAYAVGYGIALLLFVGFFAAIATAGRETRIAPIAVVLWLGGLFIVFAYIRAGTTNALWNALRVGPVRFESALRVRDVVWLQFSNLVAVLFTLGLAAPWAAVRTLRYRASKTTAIVSGPLDGFAQAEAQQVSVTGEEIADFFGIDIGL